MNKYNYVINSIDSEINQIKHRIVDLKKEERTDESKSKIDSVQSDDAYRIIRNEIISLIRKNMELEYTIPTDASYFVGPVVTIMAVPLIYGLMNSPLELPNIVVSTISSALGTGAVVSAAISFKAIKKAIKAKRQIKENRKKISQLLVGQDPVYAEHVRLIGSLKLCPYDRDDVLNSSILYKPMNEVEKLEETVKELEIKRDRVIELRNNKLLSLAKNRYDNELNSEFECDEKAKSLVKPYQLSYRRKNE